ncbi:MAG: hypothetical protein ACJ8G3_21825 [Burkholderiaceae bacterium]
MLRQTQFSRITVTAGLIGCLFHFNAQAAGPLGVPLTGTFTYQDSIAPRQDTNCPLAGMTVGTGTVSHLGKSALVSTACITFTNGIYSIVSSTITLTAANGDMLFGTYTGRFHPTNVPYIYEMNDGTLTITGGSGRFKNATGSATLQSSENLTTGEGTISAIGSISYPH